MFMRIYSVFLLLLCHVWVHLEAKSIRLLGGTLNDAVLLACIVVEPGAAFVNDDLLVQYSELGVEVDFIRQTPHPFPKTLNKFSAFYKYDPSRFDHFLWLDADVLVLGDPLPLLPELGTGKIQCVPEVYNYMKRFGMVNNSDVMWNPSLPPFVLLQEEDPVPHGVCNTGMLLFDSISLQLFLNELFRPNHLQYFEGYSDDRFIDSLAFVIAVNAASIVVEPLEYTFNFMAYFELTLKSLGFDAPPVFVHFIHDTSLLFNTREDGSCYTFYQCSHIDTPTDQLQSVVRGQIMRYFGADSVGVHNCLVMAGRLLPTLPDHARHASVKSPLLEEKEDLATVILWPEPGCELFVTEDRIDIDVIVQHPNMAGSVFESRDEDGDGRGYMYFRSFVNDMMTHDGRKAAGATSCGHAGGDVGSCRSIFTFSMLFDISNDPSFLFHIEASLLSDVEAHPRVDVRTNSFDSGAHTISGEHPPARVTCTVHFLGFSSTPDQKRQSYVASGHYVAAMGALPVSLPSQLQLSQLLNMRRAVDIGVVLCCDTVKGVHTTKNLIRHWGERIVLEDFMISFLPSGGILQVSLNSTPYGVGEKHMKALEEELAELCRKARNNFLGGCVVTRDERVRSVAGGKSFPYYREKFLSFVFSDSFSSRKSYAESLDYWYEKLSPGGVFIGSRYHVPPSSHSLTLSLPPSLSIKQAVDAFTFARGIPLLLTYAEKVHQVNGKLHNSSSLSLSSLFLEQLPAWYVLK